MSVYTSEDGEVMNIGLKSNLKSYTHGGTKINKEKYMSTYATSLQFGGSNGINRNQRTTNFETASKPGYLESLNENDLQNKNMSIVLKMFRNTQLEKR